ncbi:MAG: general secretion pathway protein GspK [Planctomycetes bacterium]|nr:general secretion pathway protein GspK [Planctomycetota bacterium]
MTSRTGVALVIVLVSVSVIASALTIALAATRASQAAVLVGTAEDHLWQGLSDGEDLARGWIARNGSAVVLTPMEADRGITIVSDHIETASGVAGITVVLYDGLAGVPAHLASAGNPLRQALPPAISSIRIPVTACPQPGQPSDLLERIELPQGKRFPESPNGPVWHWQAPDVIADVMSGDVPIDVGIQPPSIALATALAPHSDGRININTAPTHLLYAAFSLIGRGGVEQLLAARRTHHLTPISEKDKEPTAGNGIRLVDHSDCWNALITVRWNDQHRTWWTVFASSGSGFRRIQRHDADR